MTKGTKKGDTCLLRQRNSNDENVGQYDLKQKSTIWLNVYKKNFNVKYTIKLTDLLIKYFLNLFNIISNLARFNFLIAGGGDLQTRLPPLNLLLEDSSMEALQENTNFQFLIKTAYEHVARAVME